MNQRDRRVLRSNSSDGALCMYFDSLSAKAECSTITLSDSQGLLISGSGEHQEVLAAHATSIRHQVSSAPIKIGNYDFILAWKGGAPALEQTKQTVERILMLS